MGVSYFLNKWSVYTKLCLIISVLATLHASPLTNSTASKPSAPISSVTGNSEDPEKHPATAFEALSYTLFGFGAHFLGSCLPFMDSIFAWANTPYRLVKSKHFLAATLGFASGILLFTSLALLYKESVHEFKRTYKNDKDWCDKWCNLYAGSIYFVGVVSFGLLDFISKKIDNSDSQQEASDGDFNDSDVGEDVHSEKIPNPLSLSANEKSTPERKGALPSNTCVSPKERRHLFRLSIKTLAAMAIHNIPEGIVTFTTSRVDRRFGLNVAFAIVFHNFPEGLASVAPLYYATGSKMKAFLFSLLAGCAEILGALLAWAFLPDGISSYTNAVICSYTAGVLSYIPIQGLLPTARFMDMHDKVTTACFFSGIFLTVYLTGLVEALVD